MPGNPMHGCQLYKTYKYFTSFQYSVLLCHGSNLRITLITKDKSISTMGTILRYFPAYNTRNEEPRVRVLDIPMKAHQIPTRFRYLTCLSTH